MVRITIVGWYGTETIGDRAILGGLINIFQSSYTNFEINLGALYPFFTERSLSEDLEFFNICAHNNIKISIFDSSKIKQLNSAIKESDIVAIGGGPLSDIYPMYMLEYALSKAKKMGKQTMILGCGVGPLYQKCFQKALRNMVNNSDITIFRDDTSLKEYQRMFPKRKGIIASSIDPAVFAAQCLLENHNMDTSSENEKYIVACIRKFPEEYKINKSISGEEINNRLRQFVFDLSEKYTSKLLLLPMHYFGVGGDDREFLNEIKFSSSNNNIEVQNSPLNTIETMKLMKNSEYCIGMRFHSVVLQTVLNGKNIILDYTDPKTGKIGNFIKQVNGEDHYKSNYITLQEDKTMNINANIEKFNIDRIMLNNYKDIYTSNINKD